ncbi:SDR family NAD(P)-dependent oxidoreductase, partial [bacterium]|nr:SDR family NAD(P)-dependent oxidoreductase [bacterium]
MFDISGKIACVTGASSGIGAAIAESLAEAGCDLVISARREEKIREFSQYLSDKYEIRCFAGVLDVRNQKDVEKFFAELPEEFRNIEILVNNAGLAKDMTPLYENKISDWEQMIDTNVKGLLYVTKAVLPGMVERDKGHIVNIGS